MYNGSFYYHARTGHVARLDLARTRTSVMELPSATVITPASPSTAQLSINTTLVGEYQSPVALYSTGHTFMDFSVDDNGVWIIYSMENSNNTAVAKVDL